MQRQLRRLLTATGLSLAVVSLVAVPAWAAPSFVDGEAATGTEHTDALQVPEDDAIGATARVRMVAPAGFIPTDCTPSAPMTGSCEVVGQTVTWQGKGLLPFGFTLEVSAAAGAHPFDVVQEDRGGASLPWVVEMAVTSDGQEPPAQDPPPDDPPPKDGGEQEPESDDPPTGDGGPPTSDEDTPADPQPAGAASPSPNAAPSPSPSSDVDASAAADDGAGSTASGGGTAPTRTRGRSNETSLEITPGEEVGGTGPTIAAPDVVEPPVVGAPATTGDAAAAGSSTAGAAAASERPWQQVLGATLLAVGAIAVGIRQWRERRPSG